MIFSDWLKEIDVLAEKAGAGESYANAEQECWREAYDDGLSPEDAWGAEVDAAATMLG